MFIKLAINTTSIFIHIYPLFKLKKNNSFTSGNHSHVPCFLRIVIYLRISASIRFWAISPGGSVLNLGAISLLIISLDVSGQIQ